MEVTANYSLGGFNAYANFGLERGTGKQIVSSQFLFGQDELAFIRDHYVFLDHDQRYTLSTGASYTYKNTTLYAAILYGSGLRRGFANTKSVPDYGTVNLSLQRILKIPQLPGSFKIRFDIVNLFDEVYELRDGSGIGVGAPQFGQRRGFYGTVAYDF